MYRTPQADKGSVNKMDNNATIANEICKLCAVQPTPIVTIEPPVIYSGGIVTATPGTVAFNYPVIIGGAVILCILIMILCACYVHLHSLKKKV